MFALVLLRIDKLDCSGHCDGNRSVTWNYKGAILMNDSELVQQAQLITQESHTLSEILTQPVAWQAALDVVADKRETLRTLWETGEFSDILVTGCGSTYYLSLAVAPLFQRQLARRARAVPASELLLFPALVMPPDGKTLLVTISRSGRTSETVRATQAYRGQQKGAVLNIGCYDEALAGLSDLSLVIAEGQEESVVQTRSFSSMLVAAQAAIASFVDAEQVQQMHKLPTIGTQLISTYHALAQQLGENPQFERFYFLGSGLQYGLANEINLKMKEMSLSVAEAFHFMEFRHGPMSMVNEHTLVVGFLSDGAQPYELAVLREMRASGAQTLVLSDQPVPADAADYQVTFHSELPETNRAVLYLPVLQLLSYYRARKNGQHPDQPHNLTAVVMLDEEQSA
jgi:glucosamine--fructose-6-phosphate aminotransferase (isomerizing)